MADPKSLLLIDLSGIFRAAWHASGDQEVGEAFARTVSTVARLTHGHDLVAVCCDAPPYTRRKTLLPTYKAQRDKPTDVMLDQFRRVKDRLTADGLLLWHSPGDEADDVIATAVRFAIRDGLSVTVASSDKDLLQLVDDERFVRVYSPAKDKYFDETAVEETWGLPASLLLESLALQGDSSDNVPGIPGVGAKTAALLVNEFKTLDGVFSNIEKITKPKLKEALVTYEPAARLARQLIALNADASIKWEQLFEERKPMPLNDSSAEMDALAEEEPRVVPASAPVEPETKKDDAPRAVAPTSAIALHRASDQWSLALEPSSAASAWKVAGALTSARIFGKLPSQEAAFAILMRGRALGIDATTALSSFHIINGRLAMSADLIEGLVLRSGKVEYWDLVETSASRATYATKRIGGRREVSLTFTIEEACLAGLVTADSAAPGGFKGISKDGAPSNWDKWRATMLRHRAKTQLARAVYGDVVLGLFSPDEVSDGQSEVIDAELVAA